MAIGYIQVWAYTSTARLPLQNVAVSVTDPEGTVLALRLTDRSGSILPVEIPVPERASSQTPETGLQPCTLVSLYARCPGYEQIENKNIQVFEGIITRQNLKMIPLSELPAGWDQSQQFDTPAQNL